MFLDKRGCKTNTDAISARIRDYGRKHGLKISFHPFRRGYASELANSGVPIEKISKILGHSSLSVTATHYIYSRDLDEAALAYNLFNNRTFDNRQIDNNRLTLKQSIANTKAMFENALQNNLQNFTQNNTNNFTKDNINILEILSSLTAEVCDLKSLLHQKPLSS